MREIKEFDNPDLLEILDKIEPLVKKSENKQFINSFGEFYFLVKNLPQRGRTHGKTWIMLSEFYRLAIRIAYKTNVDVSKIDWFVKLTSIIMDIDYQQCKSFLSLAVETASEEALKAIMDDDDD